MNHDHLISVITVCFNSEKTIEKTINSVINQNYENIEYIIVDGGSTDKTLSIVSKYKEKINCIISEKDKGIYDAMNKGIQIASGDYIAFLNSDDYYLSNTIYNLIEEIKMNPIEGIYHGNVQYIKNNIQSIYKPYTISKNYFIYKGMPTFHPAMFVHESVFKKVGNFDTSLKILSDYKFTFSCFLAGISFYYCPKVNVAFTAGGASSLAKIRLKEGMLVRRQLGIKITQRVLSYIYRYTIVTLSRFKAKLQNLSL